MKEIALSREVLIKRIKKVLRSNKDHDTIQRELMNIFLEDLKII